MAKIFINSLAIICFISWSSLIVESEVKSKGKIIFDLLEYYPPHPSSFKIKRGTPDVVVIEIHFIPKRTVNNRNDGSMLQLRQKFNHSSNPRKLIAVKDETKFELEVSKLSHNFAFVCKLFGKGYGNEYFRESRRSATNHYYPNDGRLYFTNDTLYDISTENGCRLKFRLRTLCEDAGIAWGSFCISECKWEGWKICDDYGMPVCKSGPTIYKGERCDYDIDDCESNPCKNEGTCRNLRGGFSCICTPRFKGHTCEEDVDECASSPCFNGGFCVNHYGGYHCGCQIGFGGDNCASASHCYKLYCQNHGSCEMKGSTPRCVCPPRFTGEYCEDVMTEEVVERQEDSKVGVSLILTFGLLIFVVGSSYYAYIKKDLILENIKG